MWVEKGREFYNKDVQKLVKLYSTENEEKSCVIDRFNRTFNEKCLSISLLIIQENLLMYLTYENKVWRNLYPEFGGKTLTP